jgi:glucose/arabinose dehydrogenase
MRRLWIAIVVLIAAAASFAVAWTVASNNGEQAKQEAVAAAVADAQAEDAANVQDALQREPPTLMGPADGATFDNAAGVRLQWTWKRPLNPDEVFDLRVWRDGQEHNGITWTQDSQFNLTAWLLEQQPGDFGWSVAVMQKQPDGSGKQITDAAPERHFTMSKITMNIMDVPQGFEAQYYARLPFTEPTVITFGPDNALYILNLEGQITRMTDEDGDGFAETATSIFDDPGDQLQHAVGMVFHDGIIYISDSGRISTLSDSDGDGKLDKVNPIITGLPSLQWTFHSNNGIVFGPDGKLYVAVGATSDHGPLKERYEASVLRMNPDGSDLEVFARGLRNAYDLAFSPDGDLFTADNSPDDLGPAMPYLPPEEVDFVRQGRNYGFPTTFGDPGPLTATERPVTLLMTSSASSGLTYYSADQFPAAYHGLFLAQFGSGAPYPKSVGVSTGEMVVFISLTPKADGGYIGQWQPFARFRIEVSDYSPIDVTVGPDGSLYIAEWTTSTLYRVTYVGGPQAEATSESTAQANIPQSDLRAAGEEIFRNGAAGAPACMTCHFLGDQTGAVGPSLRGLSAVAGSRVPGLTAEQYVRQSIVDPGAFLVPNYQNVMFPNFAKVLTDDQIRALVAYVMSLH